MPISHGDKFVSRASICPATTSDAAQWRRDHPGRPHGMSFTNINADHGNCAVVDLGHGVLLCLWSPLPDSSLAGQEHGRTIPLADMRGSRLLPRFLQSYVGNMIDGVRLLGGRSWGFIVTVGDRHVEAFKFSFVEGSPRPWGFSASCFSTKTIRQSQVAASGADVPALATS